MPVQTVTIVAGTQTPIGEGINAPYRCVVRLPDDSIRKAIVKELPPQGVAAEAFCAVLLRAWGLSVPEPAIVDSPLAFASMDAGYPNMKHRIGWSEALPAPVKQALLLQGSALVAGFGETPRALAADEAIDNRDRNLGNILWDGKNVAWIDHERSMGVVPMPDVNKLAVMAISSANMQNVRDAALAIAVSMSAECVNVASGDVAAMPAATGFAQRVSTKLQTLAEAVLARFPQGTLFNAAH